MIKNKTMVIDARTGEISEAYMESVVHSPYIPSQADYEQIVEQKIRERYSSSKELAIHRQKKEKLSEWQKYYDYCEQCKAQAKKNLQINKIHKE